MAYLRNESEKKSADEAGIDQNPLTNMGIATIEAL